MLSIIIIRIAITISNCIRADIARRDETYYYLQFFNYTSLCFRLLLVWVPEGFHVCFFITFKFNYTYESNQRVAFEI